MNLPDDIQADCHLCRGTSTAGSGYVIMQQQPKGYPFPIDYGVKCDCHRQVVGMTLAQQAGIPKNLFRSSLANFEEITAEHVAVGDTIRLWRDGDLPKPGLLLRGCPGSGKSHIAAYCLKARIIESQQPGRWVEYPDILEELGEIIEEQMAGLHERSKKAFLDRFRTVPFLVLDDLGIATSSANTTRTTWQILNTRLSEGLTTIITTNLEDHELAKIIDDRNVSRLHGMCTEVRFPRIDFRTRRQAA